MELTPQQRKKAEKLAKIVEQGEVATLEHLLEVEDKFDSTVERLEKTIEEKMTFMSKADMIKIKGDKGEPYKLTEEDKESIAEATRSLIDDEEIASKLYEKIDLNAVAREASTYIPIPTDGKTPKKGVDYFDGVSPDTLEIASEASEIAIEAITPLIPTVEEVTKNVPILGEKVRDALELLEDDERLDASAIKNLPEATKTIIERVVATGGGSQPIKAGTNVSITYDGNGAQVINTTGGAPGGSDTEVQYNDGGVFGGNSKFTFNKTTGEIIQAVSGGIFSQGVAGSSRTNIVGGNAKWTFNINGSYRFSVAQSGGFGTNLYAPFSKGYNFTNGANETILAGIASPSSGNVEINNGTIGTYRDFIVRNLTVNGINSGRVPYTTTSGLLTSSSGFTNDGSLLTTPNIQVTASALPQSYYGNVNVTSNAQASFSFRNTAGKGYIFGHDITNAGGHDFFIYDRNPADGDQTVLYIADNKNVVIGDGASSEAIYTLNALAAQTAGVTGLTSSFNYSPGGTPLISGTNQNITIYLYASSASGYTKVSTFDTGTSDGSDCDVDVSWTTLGAGYNYTIYMAELDQHVYVGASTSYTLTGDDSYSSGAPDASVKERTGLSAGFVGGITVSGNSGIGTTSPTSLFHVVANSGIEPMVRYEFNSTGGYDATFSLKNNHTGGRDYWMGSSNDDNGSIGGGKFSIQDRTTGGSAGYRFIMNSSGDIIMGGLTSIAKLHVNQPTLGSSVHAITSTATNDDPTELVYQNRVATTDATVTTLHSFTIPSSTTFAIEANVVARRTGGSAGTAEDGAFYKILATFKNVSGTATQIGSTTVICTNESQAGWDCVFDTSSATARVRVTGAVDNNVTWHMTARVYKLSS